MEEENMAPDGETEQLGEAGEEEAVTGTEISFTAEADHGPDTEVWRQNEARAWQRYLEAEFAAGQAFRLALEDAWHNYKKGTQS